jgi:Domain of Unknown Function (DUF349)
MIEPDFEPTNNVDDNNINAENIVSENPELSEKPTDTFMENSEELNAEIEMETPNNEAKVEPNEAEPLAETEIAKMENAVEPETPELAETVAVVETVDEDANAKIISPVVDDTKPKKKTAAKAKIEETSSKEETLEPISEIEEVTAMPSFEGDFSKLTKKDFVVLADKMLETMNSRDLSSADVKNIDNVIKAIRPAFEEIQSQEKINTKKAYIAENGSDEGFEFKNDNHAIRFEGILIQIREKRQGFYNKLEREREDYFEIKTRLLQTLREIVEVEEKGESKNNWEAFKKLQTDWKNAGNVNSPHNGTLWSAYNALVDRYFDIRSIQNELKDLDRKKNVINKEGVVIKIEAIAESLKENTLTNVTLKKANDALLEYKSIGPGLREEQDALWDRLKKAFDVIYEKKRELSKENNSLLSDIYNAKNQILESLKPFLTFQSDSINEWNAKSKEVMAIQEQWNAIKGPMPRDKGKDISKDFWNDLKLFFKNKSEFFAKLEAKREANYKAKEILVAEAQEIFATNDHSAANTNKIIELQKKWKTIGHVPEKYKDTLYNNFKATCDQYFDLKRNENKAQDDEFAANLAKKEAICVEIEKMAAAGSSELGKLTDYKKEFGAVGFVPRKDMQTIQTRFIKAINDVVKSASGLDKNERDKLMLQNEVEAVSRGAGGSGSSRNLDKQEGDIRRKIKSLEEEIALTRNNMEFFGLSKNAEKLKEEYMKKVTKGEEELKELQDKLKVIVAAN